ncbi:NADPH-dependent ferric siderophore reductase [Streptomyces sp. CG 926]|uniref:siderophore-interacting protein n=1 Tax=Streptomyces sp. CG 926 TaxID=1882405 RepID=UPI000D6D07B2|nr:siderophore-interacting protein [Streptomyces sp. CG 926]PWK63386.1 NADPH-dependent ferric siderophore reductase [Streptomyces sp. CG 926]
MSSRSPRSVVTFPIVLRELTVLRVSDVTPGMRRVTLGGPQLHAFEHAGLSLPALRTEGFDDHVKFFFAEEGRDPVLPRQNVSSLDWPSDGRPISKDYTPVRFDPVAGEIDFDFVRHDGGIASAWAQQAAPGQVTWIAGPKMSHGHPEGADWLLVIGDETALPAIARWLDEMPEGTRARVFVEVGEDSHRQELPTRAEAEVTWLVRDGVPAGRSDLLERAVRDMEWLPGTVFVWAAGEAVTLKGIRRHLSVDRGVPREQTHITGYWRRAEVVPGLAEPADPDVLEGEDAHGRLHELTDLAPGLAIRVAVTLGLVDLVYQGVREPAELARRSGIEPRSLGALLKYLVEIEVFEVGDDGYRLTPVGEELVEDDHSSEEYDLRGAQAAFDLSLAGLAERLRSGANGCRTASGETLADALRTDARLGGSARTAIEDEARWVSTGVAGAYDWSAVDVLGAAGNGAGTVVNALVKEFPGLRVRIAALPSVLGVLGGEILDPEVLPRVELVAQTHPVPSGAGTLLLCRLLEWLPDEDAVLTLAEAAAALSTDGALVLVEQVEAADPDDIDAALHHLRLTAAFGSGLRSVKDVTALAERAGLTVRACRDVGWDHRLWVLAPTA